MTRLTPLILAAALAAGPAAANDDPPEAFRLDGDVFAAGRTVSVIDAAADDVFAAGERVTLGAPAAGSAHLAGRLLRTDGAVGADLYAAGFSVEIAAPVAGDATAAGYSVRVGAGVGGDLRAAGSEISVLDGVAGAALLAGEHIRLDGAIAGDAAIAAGSLEFGPAARIDGALTLYADADVEVPERVIPAERVTRRVPERWERPRLFGMFALGALAMLLVALAALAVLLAVAPEWTEDATEEAADRPARSVGVGFVALAAAIGAVPLLGATLIGVPLTPVMAVLAGLFAAFGWLLGVATLGAWAWEKAGRQPPLTWRGRFGEACLGLAITVVVGLIPIVGWIFTVLVALLGAGAAANAALGRRTAAVA